MKGVVVDTKSLYTGDYTVLKINLYMGIILWTTKTHICHIQYLHKWLDLNPSTPCQVWSHSIGFN